MKQINKVVLGAMLFPVLRSKWIIQKQFLWFNCKTGKLENGFNLLHQEKCQTEKKVDLRLVVNAGSILETDDQQGLAHFMEHMF
jgi:zinc protease